jgi:hypothetical protein
MFDTTSVCLIRPVFKNQIGRPEFGPDGTASKKKRRSLSSWERMQIKIFWSHRVNEQTKFIKKSEKVIYIRLVLPHLYIKI